MTKAELLMKGLAFVAKGLDYALFIMACVIMYGAARAVDPTEAMRMSLSGISIFVLLIAARGL